SLNNTLERKSTILCHHADVVHAGRKAHQILRREVRQRAPVGLEITISDVERREKTNMVNPVITVANPLGKIFWPNQVFATEPCCTFSKFVAKLGPKMVKHCVAFLDVFPSVQHFHRGPSSTSCKTHLRISLGDSANPSQLVE